MNKQNWYEREKEHKDVYHTYAVRSHFYVQLLKEAKNIIDLNKIRFVLIPINRYLISYQVSEEI